MYKEKICIIQEQEKLEITKLNERVYALKELKQGLNNNQLSNYEENKIIEKIKDRYEQTLREINIWWEDISKKYNLRKEEDCSWVVHHRTNEVFLVSSEVVS